MAPTTAPSVSDSGLSIPAGDSLWPWIALRGARPGDPYFSTRVTCFYSKGFNPEQRIYFRTAQEAEAYGLVRTMNPDCR